MDELLPGEHEAFVRMVDTVFIEDDEFFEGVVYLDS